MTGAPWKSLMLGALHRNRSDKGVRFLQLATVDEHQRPHNRTVVFRGFLPDSNILQIASDRRSDKISHLSLNPYAAICWYFAKTREQFRLSGQVVTVTAETSLNWQQQARQTLWQQLSPQAQLQWYWPQPKAERAESLAFATSLPPEAISPPETFVLLLFLPESVDRLQLRGDPQERQLFTLSDSHWSEKGVNP
jgi:PPOX class probable FMN-dependent enzyme